VNRTPANRRRSVEEEEAFGRQTMTAPVVQPKGPEAVKSVAFNFKMTKDNHQRLLALRRSEDRSIQWLLDKIVWSGVSEWEKKGGAE
jgi:hypothetical protein